MSTPDRLLLRRERAALLVIDIQTRLGTAMHPERFRQVRRNTRTLLQAASILDLPVFVTEQYPSGMGSTVADVAAELAEGQPIHEKLHFSCCGADGFMDDLQASRRDQIIVAGMETHVCVWQTVRDLLVRSVVRSVFVVEDATISRTVENHHLGLGLMAAAGAVRMGTETVLFDLLQVAGTSEFKAISKLIR
jgi:nicotinamidase-related amidase